MGTRTTTAYSRIWLTVGGGLVGGGSMILGIDPIYVILLVMLGIAALLTVFMLVMKEMLKSLLYLPKVHTELVTTRQLSSSALPRISKKSLNQARLLGVQAILTSLMSMDTAEQPGDVYTTAMRLSGEVALLKREAATHLAHLQEQETEQVPVIPQVELVREYRTGVGQRVFAYDIAAQSPYRNPPSSDPRILSAIDQRAG